MNEESRDAGYCPVCNPKNFDAWEKKIAKERARKEERREMLAKKELEAGQLKEEDRNRAVSLAAVSVIGVLFEVSIFTCCSSSTLNKYAGSNTMARNFFPINKNSIYIQQRRLLLRRNERWRATRLWTDGVRCRRDVLGAVAGGDASRQRRQELGGRYYILGGVAGERWNCLLSTAASSHSLYLYVTRCQDNMMHGVGHYVMADGTEVTGVFAEDEFVE